MECIVSLSRHVAMSCGRQEILKSFAVILTVMLADVTVIGGKITVDVGLEGSVTDHDVIIGSSINLTCKPLVTPKTSSCSMLWLKNSKRLKERTEDSRIRLLFGNHVSDNRCSVSKLVIKKFRYSDGGKYECVDMNSIFESQTENVPRASLVIRAVTCYQGFYCPNSGRKTVPKRCPRGTFSPNNNGTSIEDCLSCPEDTNERERWMKRMETKTIQMFQTNCYSSLLSKDKDGTSNLSSGVKAVIIIAPIVATLLIVAGVLYIFHRRKMMNKYRDKLLNPLKEVIYDPPKMTRSKDVFVCYSSKNREWVHATLFPNLRSQDFKVFIDFVDFEIGKSIDENIANGIYGSRKTLFILSKDSLKSLYARKELYHALAAGKTGHQVLVILYEKCKAPAEIADFVYLDWTDEKNRDIFWERLYSAIRRKLPNEVVHV